MLDSDGALQEVGNTTLGFAGFRVLQWPEKLPTQQTCKHGKHQTGGGTDEFGSVAAHSWLSIRVRD
jgi:hypothetical protein